MLNLLQVLRYCVFVVFLICNAVITSVAVWNLSIVESVPALTNAKHTDGLLIFVGAAGLVLILTILFFDLFRQNVFLVRVWFELAWVALFCILELAGAATLTAQSTSQACDASPISSSPCASNQVLQAFTWICATLLLGYLTFLSILTIVKRRDDPTIWHCIVRRFPIATNQTIKDPPPSPGYPRFRDGGEIPVIAAPVPRRLPPTHREPILSYNSGLSYRSGLGLDYEIEHYQSPESVFHAASSEEQHISRPVFTFPVTTAPPAARTSRIAEPEQVHQPVYTAPAVSSPFYHSSVQSAFKSQPPNQPQAPQPAMHVEPMRRLPPSPPPLGDWPRLDATSRPSRVKRKPLPHPESERHDSQSQQPHHHYHDHHQSLQQQQQQQPEHAPPAQPSSQTLFLPTLPTPAPPPMHRQKRPLPPTKRTPSSSYTFDAPALTAALKPLEASQSLSMRSKPSRPSGPRRKSESIDDGRPVANAAIEMPGVGTYRSTVFS